MAFVALPHVKSGIPARHEIKLKSVTPLAGSRPGIVVEFSGVTGKLRAPGRPVGFVVKKTATGERLDWIYKADFDPSRPNVVILHATSALRETVALYYGAGVAPYVNIVDDNDMPVPAFGPVSVQPR
jgi:hypothetical protein